MKTLIHAAISKLFLITLVGCVSSQIRGVAKEPNRCMPSASNSQVEEQLVKLGDQAICPAGEGFRLVPSTLPAQAVFLGYSFKYPLFLRQIIPILKRSAVGSQINIFVQHGEIAEARKFFDEIPGAQNLNLIDIPYEPTWPQDFIVMGIAGNHPVKATVLNLPYEHEPKLPAAVAKACDLPQVAPKFPSSEVKENNNFGGNIVPLPGNVVVIGSGITPTAKSVLAKSHRLVEINTEGANGWQPPSMHVDEILTVISNGQGGRCGFKIIYSSPGKALKLMAAAETPITIQSDKPGMTFTRDWNPTNCISKLGKNGDKLRSDTALSCHGFVAANREIENIVQSFLKKVLAAIKVATRCQNIETIGVPALFKPNANPTELDNYSLGYSMTINSNPVNSLILGSLIIAPEQPNDIFASVVRDAFESGGAKVEFVKATELGDDLGGVHCATNVIRTCR